MASDLFPKCFLRGFALLSFNNRVYEIKVGKEFDTLVNNREMVEEELRKDRSLSSIYEQLMPGEKLTICEENFMEEPEDDS